MKLSEFKAAIETLSSPRFILPNGNLIPIHFHVTEIGLIQKNFIDCGGTTRQEQIINFQLWLAEDFDHRLLPEKLLSIISMGENQLNLPNAEIEVEYQGETIEKFGVEFDGIAFLLTNKQTACLAEDACGIPTSKQKVKLSDLSKGKSCCDPISGCC